MSNPVNSFVFAVTVSLPKAKYLTAPHADSGVTLDEQIVDPQLSKTLSSSLASLCICVADGGIGATRTCDRIVTHGRKFELRMTLREAT